MTTEKSLGLKKLMHEIKEMTENPPPLITAELVDGNLRKWIATIGGPPGTPYEGGIFRLLLKFGPEYPFRPPDVRFITKIYHANIGSTGNICLDVLSYEWTPALSVQTLLLSIMSLLSDCNPSSPLQHAIARMYVNNRKKHDRLARDFTKKYAM